MENTRDNSSDRPPRNAQKKCYSLPLLQRENEKLKHDLNVLQADHDKKEILLAECLLKVQLLDEENQELKGLLNAAVVPNKMEMKDASTDITIDTKNESTSTSFVYVDSESQVVKEASEFFETLGANNGSTLQSAFDVVQGEDDVLYRPSSFDEIVHELPYDEPYEITMFDNNLKDLKLSLKMKQHFKQIGGATNSKIVNNILNEIATKNLQKQFVWEATATNSFQNLKNILACIYSAVCSKENTQCDVNNIIKNALKNARAKP